MLTSSIAEQGNVSDAVSQVVKVLRLSFAVSDTTVYRSGQVVKSVVPVRQLSQCQAVTYRIQLSCLSELSVKLEISLTLSGEIDNSNVKRVEEVSA